MIHNSWSIPPSPYQHPHLTNLFPHPQSTHTIRNLANVETSLIQHRYDAFMLFLHQIADDAVVEVLHRDPLDAFSLILFLLLFQDQLNEQLLKFLIAVVDAELLKAEKDNILICGRNSYK